MHENVSCEKMSASFREKNGSFLRCENSSSVFSLFFSLLDEMLPVASLLFVMIPDDFEYVFLIEHEKNFVHVLIQFLYASHVEVVNQEALTQELSHE
jgi:hypothetical protein